MAAKANKKVAPASEKTVGVIVKRALEPIAPLHLAQPWDNVGLLVGDDEVACTGILLAIDTTRAVLDEAAAVGANLLVSYHPPLFKPISRIVSKSTETDGLIFAAAARGIAIYSPHTALDAASGGTNDVLAEMCGLRNVRPFEYVAARPAERKLVVFVPPEHLEAVSEAIFAAGAGVIGNYHKCSFRLRGQGTFFGLEHTKPAVGKKGRLELVEEVRLEAVVPSGRVSDVVSALRAAHPYEEPAFDLYPLEAPRSWGIGRVGELEAEKTLSDLATDVARKTGMPKTEIIGGARARVRRVAVCVGSAGRLPFDKLWPEVWDVMVTGEIRHHDALVYQRHGKVAIALGHWASERPVLAPLARQIRARVGELPIIVSKADHDPFEVVSLSSDAAERKRGSTPRP